MSIRLTRQAFALGAATGSGVFHQRSRLTVGATQLSAAFASSAHPLIIVDAFDRIQIASSGAEKLLGASLYCGGSLWSHVTPTNPAAAQTLLRRSLAGAASIDLILSNHQVARATLEPLCDTRGEATHVSVSLQVAETNPETILASVGRLAGALAHDINNQLAAAINNVYILKRRLELSDPLSGHLDELRSATWRAAALAGSLTHVARRHALQAAPSSLNDTVIDLLPLLRHLARDVDVELQPGRGLPQLRTPLTELEQVITSIVIFSLGRADKGSALRLETSMTPLERMDSPPSVRLTCIIHPVALVKKAALTPASRRLHGVVRRALKRCNARIGHNHQRVWVDFLDLDR